SWSNFRPSISRVTVVIRTFSVERCPSASEIHIVPFRNSALSSFSSVYKVSPAMEWLDPVSAQAFPNIPFTRRYTVDTGAVVTKQELASKYSNRDYSDLGSVVQFGHFARMKPGVPQP
ncbi:hypothetical protein AVEN_138065-1, partial [Araneus ventricosus]